VSKVKCDKCGGKMMIAESKFVTEVDSTDVYNELKMVCINPKCPEFGGPDLNKSTRFKTVRRKVN
jgi:predicted metal-binding protein